MTRILKDVALSALAAGTVAVLLGALPGMAEARGMGGGAFAMIDTDKDGNLSLDEFTARAKARFEALDNDGDGLLSADEAARLGKPSGRRDGARGGYGMGSGRIQGHPGMGYGMFGGMQGTGPMQGGFGDPALTDEERAARAADMVEMLDADGDGKLSANEMATRPGPEMIFNRVDADGDGTISRDEFDAAAKKFGGRFGPQGVMR
ncbi:EF hand domain-containing protein [Rhodovulum bhavnagarense]|uniref:EF hand domain-containing protein n=1 Tax=Rhodovulum bhavnagarense TaxID=992286 RepID=A0A4R2RFI6_9RHOB|nr:EF-hand domain-containing protein [Rhodovulum bhavnagarense]TCP60837.1 EF hand domain-containing protein [Rhodovulum bhavnagarense]